MKYIYSIRIDTDSLSKENIEDIIGIKSNFEYATWGIEIEEREFDEPIYFVRSFMNIIEDKIPILESFGIERDEITIWKLYAYNDQCNMEFDAEDLFRLGKNGIKLCISCWEE